MRSPLLWFFGLAGCCTLLAQTITFDTYSPGQLPPAWSAVSPGSRWEISRDETAPSKPYVLAQRPCGGHAGAASVIVWDKANFRDGDVFVKFKPVGGERDRSGGVVWRYRDSGNYYVLDADAVRNRLVLSKVQNGAVIPLMPRHRRFVSYPLNRRVPTEEWSILHVKIRGSRYVVYFDHREVFEVEDATFLGPGKAGLWAQADSVTYFDDFQVKPR